MGIGKRPTKAFAGAKCIVLHSAWRSQPGMRIEWQSIGDLT